MDYNEIRNLLKKYWAAETDLAEESQLKDFSRNNVDIPGDLLAEKHLFMMYNQDANQPKLNEDLTGKLRLHLTKRTIPFWRTALKYAAILMPLAVLSYFIFREKNNADPPLPVKETITKKDEAIEEVNTALIILSVNMKDGLANVKKLEILKDIGQELNEKHIKKEVK